MSPQWKSSEPPYMNPKRQFFLHSPTDEIVYEFQDYGGGIVYFMYIDGVYTRTTNMMGETPLHTAILYKKEAMRELWKTFVSLGYHPYNPFDGELNDKPRTFQEN